MSTKNAFSDARKGWAAPVVYPNVPETEGIRSAFFGLDRIFRIV